jgi:hypothetical protein
VNVLSHYHRNTQKKGSTVLLSEVSAGEQYLIANRYQELNLLGLSNRSICKFFDINMKQLNKALKVNGLSLT